MNCTMGIDPRSPCPACKYIHGDLPKCAKCGHGWTPSLQELLDREACGECRTKRDAKKRRVTG